MPEPSGGAVGGGAWWYADSSGNPLTDVDGRAFDAGTIVDDWQVCRTGIGGSTAGGNSPQQALGNRIAVAAVTAGGSVSLQALALLLASGGSIAGGTANLLTMALQGSTGGAVVGGTFGLPPSPTALLRVCYTVKVSRQQFLADNYKTTVRRRY